VLVDFHNHVLPGVDDGARDPGETRAALLAMYRAGVHLVIVSPHVSASALHDAAAADALRERLAAALDVTRRIAAAETPDLRVECGAEILLDHAEPELADPCFRLAGGEFVLVEFSFFGIPPTASDILFRVRAQGRLPILGHPERYPGLSTRVTQQWHGSGTLMQVNAGSLLGDYGPEGRRRAWGLLQLGLVHYVCSDYHSRGKYRLPEALEAIARRGGEEQRDTLIANGVRLSRGERPRDVRPLKRRSWLRSLLKR
jgi:protein-tyrosine phosphatase